MTNWRTTLCGVLTAVAAYIIGHPTEVPQWLVGAANIIAPLATSLGLVFAKDVAHKENVDGGS